MREDIRKIAWENIVADTRMNAMEKAVMYALVFMIDDKMSEDGSISTDLGINILSSKKNIANTAGMAVSTLNRHLMGLRRMCRVVTKRHDGMTLFHLTGRNFK